MIIAIKKRQSGPTEAIAESNADQPIPRLALRPVIKTTRLFSLPGTTDIK